MLTPQEVSEHAFAKASFGGYNMAMVDEFLDVLTADYTTLYKENATLKAKMKVVEKVEEYRSTEDAMRKALLTAQKMADDLVAEAEAKRSKLLQNAEADAKARIGELQQEIRDEQLRLAAAQNATAVYVGKVKELCQQELDYLGSLSALTAPAAKADPVASAAREIEQSVEKLVRQEAEPAAQPEAEPQAAPAQEGGLYAELMELNRGGGEVQSGEEDDGDEAEEPTRRIDFDHLQFGKDYEIR